MKCAGERAARFAVEALNWRNGAASYSSALCGASAGHGHGREFRCGAKSGWPTGGCANKKPAYGSKQVVARRAGPPAVPKVAMVEGAPDLLAAFHFIVTEGRKSS